MFLGYQEQWKMSVNRQKIKDRLPCKILAKLGLYVQILFSTPIDWGNPYFSKFPLILMNL